jgi:hypothetical protein
MKVVSRTHDEGELEREFNKILLEAIDKALGMLGASIKEALYFHLETTFAVKKEIICKDPEKFSDGLEKIFGLGAKFLENVIINSVCEKTKCKPNPSWQEYSFGENIKKIKMNYIQNKTGENSKFAKI